MINSRIEEKTGGICEPFLPPASADPSAITGPKKLGVYGATYIWAIFRGMGLFKIHLFF